MTDKTILLAWRHLTKVIRIIYAEIQELPIYNLHNLLLYFHEHSQYYRLRVQNREVRITV